jgi:hypothetical protein
MTWRPICGILSWNPSTARFHVIPVNNPSKCVGISLLFQDYPPQLSQYNTTMTNSSSLDQIDLKNSCNWGWYQK